MIVICVLGLHDVNKPQRNKLHHKFSPDKIGHQWVKKNHYILKVKKLLPSKRNLLPGRRKR